jgi:elongation factor Tu
MSLFSKIFKKTTQNPKPPKQIDQYKQGTFQVDDIFSITGRGMILVGKVLQGGLHIDFESEKDNQIIKIKGIESHNKQQKMAKGGNMAGLLVDENLKDVVKKGDVLEFHNKL